MDGGETWKPAPLLETSRPSAWVRWAFTWEDAAPGRHALRARATDEAGETQPETAPWNRLGLRQQRGAGAHGGRGLIQARATSDN